MPGTLGVVHTASGRDTRGTAAIPSSTAPARSTPPCSMTSWASSDLTLVDAHGEGPPSRLVSQLGLPELGRDRGSLLRTQHGAE